MFHVNLKTAMEKRGVNQKELSLMTGIGKTSISQYLSGINKPHPKYIKLLSEALECDYDYLSRAQRKDAPPKPVSIKNISISDAAERMGKSRQFIRISLQQGVAPFGFAVKCEGGQWSYHISPAKFEKYLLGEVTT
jgi:transcriptional regulator with XRE-family HTH domain